MDFRINVELKSNQDEKELINAIKTGANILNIERDGNKRTIDICARTLGRKKKADTDEEARILQDRNLGMTLQECAKKHNLSVSTICNILSRCGVIKHRDYCYDDIYQLKQEGMSLCKIAKTLNISRSTVYNIINNPDKRKNETDQLKTRNREILKEYNEGVSVKDIAERHNLSVPSIYVILRKERKK